MPAPAQAIQGQIDGATSARAIRASLVAAAIPDPWAVLAIVAAILLLRWMRLKGSPQQLRPQMAEEALEEGGRAA